MSEAWSPLLTGPNYKPRWYGWFQPLLAVIDPHTKHYFDKIEIRFSNVFSGMLKN
jgi:hypothetical protein